MKRTDKSDRKFRISPDTGNKTLLTEEVMDKMEELFGQGLPDSTVAKFLGISPQLLKEWLVKGAAYGRGIHGELFLRCAKAQGQFEYDLVVELNKHMFGAPAEYERDKRGKIKLDENGKPILLKEEVKSNPKWIAWFLEKRFWTSRSDNSFDFGAELNEKAGVSEPSPIHDFNSYSEQEIEQELERLKSKTANDS